MRQYEFVAFGVAAGGEETVGQVLVHSLPSAPGGMLRDEVSGVTAMHFAPRRWLLVGGAEAVTAAVEEAVAAGKGLLADVTGKYCPVTFPGELGRATLASTVNLDAVLGGDRDCAAVLLFDSPAILARLQGEHTAWVVASHLRDFTAAAARAASICEKMNG